jgi:hypothetical protein
MKNKTEVPVIQYPFDNFTKAYLCRCGKTLRKSNLHNRIYEVSVMDNNEIRKTKPHICSKDLSKNKGGKIR